MSSRNQSPDVVLFGYESSAFTWKVRIALRLKQVPYTFVTVESMMPRPKLREAFNLTYRRIPVLAIGRDVYCDTSLICDALEHFYPESEGYPSLSPTTADGRDQSSIMRGFAAYWVGAPFYRATCAVMPADIWRTSFGTDRGGLVGHAIDANKLEKKIPEGMWKLDHHFSMLERFFRQPDSENRRWLFSTDRPSLADLALYAQLWWCREISTGNLMENLTGGDIPDSRHPGIGSIFNEQRHPGLLGWFQSFEEYLAKLPSTETKDPDWNSVLQTLRAVPDTSRESWLLPTPNEVHKEVDANAGLKEGNMVSIYPDETGRFDPTIGELLATSPEEFVIKPKALEKRAEVDVRVHFPRLAFVARPVGGAKL